MVYKVIMTFDRNRKITIATFIILFSSDSVGDLLNTELFCCYKYLLSESESSDYARNGFEYGIKLKLNLKKILFRSNFEF